MTTTVTKRIEGHAKVSGPEMLVNSGKVDTHLIECFNNVMIWFDPQVSHPAQPIVHPLDSPVSIFMEEKIVSTDESTKSSNTRRDMRIVHQILHHLLCHVHSSHLSRPTSDQQGVCHDSRMHFSVSLHLLEQVHRTIHVLRLDQTLHECVVSTIVRSHIEGRAKVSGPEWFVHSRKVKSHLAKVLNGVVTRFESKVSHLG